MKDYHLEAIKMATDLSSPGSLIAWASSLKEQIGEKLDSGENEQSSVKLSESLRGDLIEAIDWLVLQASEGDLVVNREISQANPALSDQVSEVLNSTLAEWQTAVSNGFAQGVARELDGQLKIAQRLNTELREQEGRLAFQQTECQKLQTSNLRQQANLTRQRKSIAKSLRAQKAQLLLEIEQQRQQLRDEVKRELELHIRSEIEQELNNLQGLLTEQEQKATTLEEQLSATRDELTQISEKWLATDAGWQALLAKSNEHIEQLQVDLRAADQQPNQERTSHQVESSGTEEKLKAERASLDAELKATRKQLKVERAKLQAELKTAEDKLLEEQAHRQEEHADASAMIELREQLELCQIEIDDLSAAQEKLCSAELELEDLRKKFAELEEASESARGHEAVAENAQKTNEELEEKLEALQLELEQTTQELLDQGQEIEFARESDTRVEQIKRVLRVTQDELTDLRAQNVDLASQLAKLQVASTGTKPHVHFDQESLTWEERKALIMRQLEEDSPADEEESKQLRLEIERVLRTTQQEVEKRDREIEELRSIVQQQSDTKQGVAIGAAAIAQMLDSDELISQERAKLKEIQKEWEEKLRQAEIDLSMERARLSRERTQLEAELEDAKYRQESTQEQGKEGKVKTRKWLEHLGLRDESPKN